MSTTYTPEALAAAAAVSTSITEVVRRLGGKEVGGTQAHVGRQLRRFGIDLSHFTTLQPPPELPQLEPAQLAAAVDGAGSMAEVLRRLGLGRVTVRLNRHIEAECARWSVDLTGLGHRRFKTDAIALAAAVARSTSIVETMAALGLDGRNNERKVARAIDRQGLDTSRFVRRAWRTPLPRPAPVTDVLVHEPKRTKRVGAERLRRALVAAGFEHRCADCGIGPEWLGRAMTLEIDHINGDITNNLAGNLRFLCPNRHAVTDTYCRRKRPDSRLAN